MSSTSKRKVALVFTGAVSLGSFEAGVAYEIVKHILEKQEPELEVDVIVGTSAGALTGALAAMALVFGLDPSALEESWLSVRLDDLLRLNPGDRSILSSSKVENLIAKYLDPQLAQKQAVNSNGRREVKLAIVVTNLDGMKYDIHRTKNEEFSISAIGYEDAIKFCIKPGFNEWERLRSAVRASSAYPGAFEHKKIMRTDNEFSRTAKYNFTGTQERYFHYSDGGIVNNQPLNKAIEIVNDLTYDRSGEGYERLFLVIDPAPPSASLSGHDYKVFDVISKALWTIPRNQTLYKDLLFLEKVNRRIRWKNSFISAVTDMWNCCSITDEHRKSLEQLSKEVADFKGRTMLGVDYDRYMKFEEERIRTSYRDEINRVNNRDLFVKYCFLMEHVADLRNKQEVSVEMIRPQDAEQELAGEIFGNFGGFLDSGFMKHDYNVGRTYARRWLKKENEMNRLVSFNEQELSPRVRFRIFQKMLDNAVPLLMEDIGPRLFLGNGALRPDLGMFTLAGMVSVSMVRYVVNKTVGLAKQMVFGKK
ncbi:MAG TPA: patatin-like phospholipase family protein [Desulfobacteria bacterium]|nr:patatin-like phospholipase family protein [Desulfobacteria bacterium]